jgi:hypothetical protein
MPQLTASRVIKGPLGPASDRDALTSPPDPALRPQTANPERCTSLPRYPGPTFLRFVEYDAILGRNSATIIAGIARDIETDPIVWCVALS